MPDLFLLLMQVFVSIWFFLFSSEKKKEYVLFLLCVQFFQNQLGSVDGVAADIG